MERRIKIGYISVQNPYDKSSWSGTNYYLFKALKAEGLNVVLIGKNYYPKTRLKKILSKFLLLAKPNAGLYNDYEKNVREELKNTGCDIALMVVHSKAILNGPFNIPSILISDATFKLLNGYYDAEPLNDAEISSREASEFKAIKNATHLVYTSDSAAESAIRDYGASSKKVSVINLGANIDKINSTKSILNKKIGSTCHVLFYAKEWLRKGGPNAVHAVQALNEMGIKAKLNIVGIRSPRIQSEFIINHGFLRKDRFWDYLKLLNILRKSHFLILPTKADCTPTVIAEVNAFGIPALSNRIGGLPSLIKDGINGYLFDSNSTGNDYAEKIRDIWLFEKKYRALSLTSYEFYNLKLNYKIWGKKMHSLISSILK